jgi:hypothetical protein
MKRGSTTEVAAGSAFVRAGQKALRKVGPPSSTVRLRIHPAALAFVAGAPGLIGATSLLATALEPVPNDGRPVFGIVLLAVAVLLVGLGLASRLVVSPDGVTVRFFGLRSTTVRFDELVAATFSMTFPAISYAITLRDRAGRKAVVHANWWRDEGMATVPTLRALVEAEVAMDRTTARIVSQVLGVARPAATIVHRGLIWKDRTW